MGRPTKLTVKTKEKILNFIRMGLPIERACAASGISKNTYYQWIKRGNEGKQPYKDFNDALEAAEAEAQAVLTQKLQNSDNPLSWKFILERRWPDEWGQKRTDINLTTLDKDGNRVGFGQMSDEALLAYIAEAEKQGAQ